ncbi:MAG TPA: ABC transporter substrate-binding protein [Acidimicrobiales bacterium]|nr:ABC transporter substrate-binding protein [Acidimicrobiales bacterium]
MIRTVPSLVLAGALLLGAAGCGSSSGSGSSSASTTTAAGGGSSTAGSEDLGNVLALGEEFLLADLLALGITPVASTATVADAGFSGIDEADTEGIEALPSDQANFEQLASLDIDTILVQQYVIDEIGRSELDAIGEVIVVPTGTGAEELTELGELVGREDEAAELVDQLEAARADAADSAGDDCAVSLATIYPGPTPAAWVGAPNNVAIALQDMGCTLVPSEADEAADGAGRVYLSLENLGLLSAPQLILLQSSDVEGEDASLHEVEQDSLWEQLPAVEADRVTTLDRLGYPGVAGLIRLYDELGKTVA